MRSAILLTYTVNPNELRGYRPDAVHDDPNRLLAKHGELVHSENRNVTSHVQRPKDGWIINTIMIEGYDVPFRFKRKKSYRNLKGSRVNLTYYSTSEAVAGIEMEVMNVVRIRVS